MKQILISLIMVVCLAGCRTIREESQADKQWKQWVNIRVIKLGVACNILRDDALVCQKHRAQYAKDQAAKVKEIKVNIPVDVKPEDPPPCQNCNPFDVVLPDTDTKDKEQITTKDKVEDATQRVIIVISGYVSYSLFRCDHS